MITSGLEFPFPGKVQVRTVVYKHRRSAMQQSDGDNMLAWLKSSIDGIADAGIVANDRQFSYLPVEFRYDPTAQRVELELIPVDSSVVGR